MLTEVTVRMSLNVGISSMTTEAVMLGNKQQVVSVPDAVVLLYSVYFICYDAPYFLS